MKPAAGGASNLLLESSVCVIADINKTRLQRDLERPYPLLFSHYWKDRNTNFIAKEHFEHPKVVLEIGAGTGWFLLDLARANPETFYIGVERCRMRANRLIHRTKRASLPNVAGYRGNAIPALIHGIASESVDRIYILYPCPWPKTSQRKNRWYLHPIMPHLVRILKPNGILYWASDQAFYIEEAAYTCTQFYGLNALAMGPLKPNPWNDLANFPQGRTKFEATFLASGLTCYELVIEKSLSTKPCNPN